MAGIRDHGQRRLQEYLKPAGRAVGAVNRNDVDKFRRRKRRRRRRGVVAAVPVIGVVVKLAACRRRHKGIDPIVKVGILYVENPRTPAHSLKNVRVGKLAARQEQVLEPGRPFFRNLIVGAERRGHSVRSVARSNPFVKVGRAGIAFGRSFDKGPVGAGVYVQVWLRVIAFQVKVKVAFFKGNIGFKSALKAQRVGHVVVGILVVGAKLDRQLELGHRPKRENSKMLAGSRVHL